jgi:hypothetical protein
VIEFTADMLFDYSSERLSLGKAKLCTAPKHLHCTSKKRLRDLKLFDEDIIVTSTIGNAHSGLPTSPK